MVMKFNPKTNRFEKVGGVPAGATPPTGTTIPTERGTRGSTEQSRADRASRQRATRTTGAVGVDPKTGLPVDKDGNVVPVVVPPDATLPPPTTIPKGRATTTTTVPKAPPTTVAPKTTTTTVPASPTTTAPASPTTTVPTFTKEELDIINEGQDAVLQNPELVGKMWAYINSASSGSSGSDAATKARIAADAKVQAAKVAAAAQKKAAKKAADIYEKSGADTQAEYNKLAESQYADTAKRAKEYYGGQKTTASGNIDKATADFLQNLIAPTAYSNASVAELAPEQQGLLKSLQAYGATGGEAAQQMATDTASNKFLADLMRSSNTQLQAADVGYFNALKNAATGGQMAARQGLEGIITGLQGQSTAQAEAIRRELLSKGIEALLSGQQNAANVIAGAQ